MATVGTESKVVGAESKVVESEQAKKGVASEQRSRRAETILSALFFSVATYLVGDLKGNVLKSEKQDKQALESELGKMWDSKMKEYKEKKAIEPTYLPTQKLTSTPPRIADEEEDEAAFEPSQSKFYFLLMRTCAEYSKDMMFRKRLNEKQEEAKAKLKKKLDLEEEKLEEIHRLAQKQATAKVTKRFDDEESAKRVVNADAKTIGWVTGPSQNAEMWEEKFQKEVSDETDKILGGQVFLEKLNSIKERKKNLVLEESNVKKIVREVQDEILKTVQSPMFLADPLNMLPDIQIEQTGGQNDGKVTAGVFFDHNRFITSIATRVARFDTEILHTLEPAQVESRLSDIIKSFGYMKKHMKLEILSGLPAIFDPFIGITSVETTHILDCMVCRAHYSEVMKNSEKGCEKQIVEENRLLTQINQLKMEKNSIDTLWRNKEEKRLEHVSCNLLTQEELEMMRQCNNTPKPAYPDDPIIVKSKKPADSKLSDTEWDDAEELRIARIELKQFGKLRVRVYPDYKKMEETFGELQSKVNELHGEIESERRSMKFFKTADVPANELPEGASKKFPMKKYTICNTPFLEYPDGYDRTLRFCPECKMVLACKPCLYGHGGRAGHVNGLACHAWKTIRMFLEGIGEDRISLMCAKWVRQYQDVRKKEVEEFSARQLKGY